MACVDAVFAQPSPQRRAADTQIRRHTAKVSTMPAQRCADRIGFGLTNDRIHAPNEKFELSCFETGCRTHALVLAELGKLRN